MIYLERIHCSQFQKRQKNEMFYQFRSRLISVRIGNFTQSHNQEDNLEILLEIRHGIHLVILHLSQAHMDPEETLE